MNDKHRQRTDALNAEGNYLWINVGFFVPTNAGLLAYAIDSSRGCWISLLGIAIVVVWGMGILKKVNTFNIRLAVVKESEEEGVDVYNGRVEKYLSGERVSIDGIDYEMKWLERCIGNMHMVKLTVFGLLFGFIGVAIAKFI